MTSYSQSTSNYFIGLMSGTSLDGVDAVLCQFNCDTPLKTSVIHTHHLPYDEHLKGEILALHYSGPDELHRAAILAQKLSKFYAKAVNQLLNQAKVLAKDVDAIGCHGQTIRHQPQAGYTIQLLNSAVLTELTGITVVSDFRSRDIAAGGQGAPLVPAFHQALFSDPKVARAIINIGGIANISILSPNKPLIGFDTGPGNMLMDMWIKQHQQQAFDEEGAWAAGGKLHEALLAHMMQEPFLSLPPPKSTGRDLFNHAWLDLILAKFSAIETQDVQRTLLEYTVATIAQAVKENAPECQEIYLCGGGAKNLALVESLRQKLHPVKIAPSDDLGVPVNWVEALAFAWLARQSLLGRPANLPSVTGAIGERVLGAVYAR